MPRMAVRRVVSWEGTTLSHFPMLTVGKCKKIYRKQQHRGNISGSCAHAGQAKLIVDNQSRASRMAYKHPPSSYSYLPCGSIFRPHAQSPPGSDILQRLVRSQPERRQPIAFFSSHCWFYDIEVFLFFFKFPTFIEVISYFYFYCDFRHSFFARDSR